MEQPAARLPVSRRRRTRQYFALAGAIALVLAAVGALAYYGDEIHLYLSLGGWNTVAATGITRQFIDRLQSGKLQQALALVDPGSYQPYREGGKLVGLEHVDNTTGRGRYRVRFDELVPPGPVQLRPPQLTTSDQGGFVVPVRFADRTEGWFVVGRVRDGYRITGIPTVPGRFHY